MPQLVDGAKWVFGWVVVGPGNEIRIPPAAFAEYGFQSGEFVLHTCGSRRSGGFSIGRQEILAGSILQSRCIGKACIGLGEKVVLPALPGLQPGDRLLGCSGQLDGLGIFTAWTDL